MKNNIKSDDNFVLFTITISALLSLLYCWKIYLEKDFKLIGLIIVGMNLLYIPIALIFRKRAFCSFYLIYSIVILYAAAFEKTYLYNNYTALFIVCIVIMMQPKLRIPAIAIYFAAVTIFFILNEEKEIYLYLIHVIRSLWYIALTEFVLNDKFRRKKLVLYEDERRILDQLCEGKVYQKEFAAERDQHRRPCRDAGHRPATLQQAVACRLVKADLVAFPFLQPEFFVHSCPPPSRA